MNNERDGSRSCFCYSPTHGAAIIGIAFYIGSTVVSLMLAGLVVEWPQVLLHIEYNNRDSAGGTDCEWWGRRSRNRQLS